MKFRLTVPIAAAAAGAGVFAIVRWLGFRRRRLQTPDIGFRDYETLIDEAGLESFPANDPPGWTLGEDDRT